MITRAYETQLVFDADTDVGRSRQGKPNQDSIGTYEDFCRDAALLAAKGKLFVVADGMGGAAGGKDASSLAVDTIARSFYADPDDRVVPSLERAVQAANTAIHQHGRAHPELRGMGTTVVVAVIRDATLVVGNVGDSRAYLFRGDALTQLSLDHTSVQEQVRAGVLTPDEAAVHPRRHVLSRNLGFRPQAQPDFDTRSLRSGDTVVLCSDGLWGSVEDQDLAAVLRNERGERAVEMLIDLANERGGPDNISAIVIHVDRLAAVAEGNTARTSALIGSPTESQTEAYRATVDEPDARPPSAMPGPAAARPFPSGAGTTAGHMLPTRLRRAAAAPAAAAPRRVPLWSVALAGAALVVLIGAYLAWSRFSFPGVVAGEQPIGSPAAQAPAPTSDVGVSASFAPAASTVAAAGSQPAAAPPSPRAPGAEVHGSKSSVDVALSLPSVPLHLAHKAAVMSLAVSDDTQLLATGSKDGSIHLWDAKDGTRMGAFAADSAPITSLAFSADGQWLASASAGVSGTLSLWSLQPPASSGLSAFQFHRAASVSRPFVASVAFGPEGQLTAVEQDTALSVWKLPLLDVTRTFPALISEASDVVVAADGRTRAIVEPDRGVRLWSGDGVTSSAPAWQPQAAVIDLAVAADGQTLAAVEADGAVMVWRAHEAAARQRRSHPDQPVKNVAISSDGDWLLVAQDNGTVEWWAIDEISPVDTAQPAGSLPAPPLPAPRP